MSTAAAVMAAKRREIIRKFREANAYDQQTAINAGLHGIRMSFLFKRLINDGVILPAGKDMYFLDAAREEETRKFRRKIAVIAILLIITAGLIAYFVVKNR